MSSPDPYALGGRRIQPVTWFDTEYLEKVRSRRMFYAEHAMHGAGETSRPGPIAAMLVAVGLACGAAGTSSQRDWDAERRRMVAEQLSARDITKPRVLDAMLTVPRHLFVPEPQRAEAYGDSPLPIGHDQTISQPYIVAFMTQALDIAPEHRVLEIGTGSGYQAAVLGALAKDVYTIEIVPPLAERARETLSALGYRNIQVRTGNGYLGWPEHAPYDRIMVTAAPDEVPAALLQQLKIGGLDGHSGGNRDPGTADPAPHRHRDRDAAHASGAVRADDGQAEVESTDGLR